MKDHKIFIRAYQEFKKTIDLKRGGVLPELNRLVWCVLMGIPPVPADEYHVPDAQEIAIDQRIAILKALFVEINKDQPDEFIDKGLSIYDAASRLAKGLLKEEMMDELNKFLESYTESCLPFDDYKDI